MPPLAAATLATAVAFLVLDMIWLAGLAKDFNKSQIGPLLQMPINFPAAAAFYVLYIAGLVFFAVRPAVASGEWTQALALGAGVGLLAYGTYDLTNMATLKGWTWAMAGVDMAWGTVLSAACATAGYFAARQVGSG